MIPVEIIEKHTELNKRMNELKLWLKQKEVVSYTAWKEDNPKDRSAMDKVVAKLKLDDETWLEKEIELEQSEVQLKKVNLTIDGLKGAMYVIGSEKSYDKGYFDELVKNYTRLLEED